MIALFLDESIPIVSPAYNATINKRNQREYANNKHNTTNDELGQLIEGKYHVEGGGVGDGLASNGDSTATSSQLTNQLQMSVQRITNK